MKKVLVTGAGGFVGTHLIHALKAKGDVEIFANVYSATSDITSLLPEDHIISGDLTDYAFAEKLIKVSTPDIIYHLAAISVVHSSSDQTTKVLNANSTITFNVLEATKLYATNARFISVCSANVYGLVNPSDLPLSETAPLRPLNAYAVSKITQEMLTLQYHLSYGLDVVILRPFNHSGVGQTPNFLIPALAKQFATIEKGAAPVIEVGNIESSRDYTDVRDIAQAYILAADKCISGEVYNIGTGRSYKTSEIIDIFRDISGLKVELKEVDSLVRTSDVPILIADVSKFRSLTNWEPKIPLTQTISDILESYRKI